jgi:hypothetical protein
VLTKSQRRLPMSKQRTTKHPKTDEEPPSGLAKVKILVQKGIDVKKTPAPKKATVSHEQEKGSTATTLSFGCIMILEAMTQPLRFLPLSPLGPALTQFMPTSKDSDEGGKSLKGKEILYEEEVESPHILGLGSAAFRGLSFYKKDGATKSAKKSANDDRSWGHKKTEEGP